MRVTQGKLQNTILDSLKQLKEGGQIRGYQHTRYTTSSSQMRKFLRRGTLQKINKQFTKESGSNVSNSPTSSQSNLHLYRATHEKVRTFLNVLLEAASLYFFPLDDMTVGQLSSFQSINVQREDPCCARFLQSFQQPRFRR